MLLAAGGAPTLAQVFWITVAMGAARTLAMVLNRLIDREIDARNPRTANRALPRRLLSAREMGLFGALALAVLVLAAWQLNPLCLQLLPGAVVILVGYSYTKRFTWASHFVLGLADALAPIGGWVAVTGALAPEALLLGFAVGVWIAGFDVLYACQDVEFDRASGLHSIPARFGIPAALNVARVLHVLTVGALGRAGAADGAGAGLLAGRAGRRRAPGLRALPAQGGRPLPAGHGLLQRQRLHRRDPLPGHRRRPGPQLAAPVPGLPGR